MAINIHEKIGDVLRIHPPRLAALQRIGIETVRDMLYYFPSRYIEFSGLKKTDELVAGEHASVIGVIESAGSERSWNKRMGIATALIRDEAGLIKAAWFNQPYIAGKLKPGMRVLITGKILEQKGKLYFGNPKWEAVGDGDIAKDTQSSGRHMIPVYSETYGISSSWLGEHIGNILQKTAEIPELLPKDIIEKYRLPPVKRALFAMHFPKKLPETEAARKRFSFEEIFLIQLDRHIQRKKLEAEKGIGIKPDKECIKKFKESLPYSLTGAQDRVIEQILEDFSHLHPMARLLEGDVGSGKTIVAAAASLNVTSQNYQVAFMAPTEILARQHFEEFTKRFTSFRKTIGLLTSSESRKFPSKVAYKSSAEISNNQLLKWILSGEIDILIGTHSLIQDRVKFKNLGLVIVDEQHRFGVDQRSRLLKTKNIPHLLSMSATPIPRTLALTLYGDLDLSVLDEMPPGRKRIITKVVSSKDRNLTYEFIRSEINKGRQAFVICPRIERKDESKPASTAAAFAQRLRMSEMKAVKEEFKKLKETIFPEFQIGMLHGKLRPKEKEAIMGAFKDNKTNILVSTSVVEVGVDISNATIMMIEGGERFGLSQLHQFRGRVGRGEHQSYCFVFTSNDSGKSSERLKALQEAKTGFELAEYDLQLRGAGQLSGTSQWGVSDVGMDALKNIKLVEFAREEARRIIEKDPTLADYPLLKERVREAVKNTHFE
ncbi:MAG: ATP-dependent DNA helicase RecG [Candidatus Sungbacteria bacterium]|nr:ATP-dependent DNA helicase RecG [Candidatus Sungbacteria bacterium]